MNTYEGIKGIYDLVEQIRRWRWKDNAADMLHARDLPSPNAVRREQLGKSILDGIFKWGVPATYSHIVQRTDVFIL